MPKATPDANLQFLYTCLLKSDYSSIDYNAVAAAYNINTNAARIRFIRLRKYIEDNADSSENTTRQNTVTETTATESSDGTPKKTVTPKKPATPKKAVTPSKGAAKKGIAKKITPKKRKVVESETEEDDFLLEDDEDDAVVDTADSDADAAMDMA